MFSTKKLPPIIFSGFLIATNFLHSKPVNAAGETFYDPTVRFKNGRTYRISVCAISPKYPSPCTETTMKLAATAFCLGRKYNTMVDYKWNETSKTNVSVLTQEYRNGQLLSWWQLLESSYIFTQITCGS